jgi:hypothetical protein
MIEDILIEADKIMLSLLIRSIISESFFSKELIFFIPNEGDVIFEFSSDKGYKYALIVERSSSGKNFLKFYYDSDNSDLIKTVSDANKFIKELRKHLIKDINELSEVEFTKFFYELKSEETDNGIVYRFTKK